MGTDLSWAAEGHDAKNISFTTAQSVLIERVSCLFLTQRGQQTSQMNMEPLEPLESVVVLCILCYPYLSTSQVAAAAKKPVVIVTFTAVPLDVSEILANPKASLRNDLGVRG